MSWLLCLRVLPCVSIITESVHFWMVNLKFQLSLHWFLHFFPCDKYTCHSFYLLNLSHKTFQKVFLFNNSERVVPFSFYTLPLSGEIQWVNDCCRGFSFTSASKLENAWLWVFFFFVVFVPIIELYVLYLFGQNMY